MSDWPVIFINSHPIQYFAPLYKYLNANGVNASCWYCSDETVKGHIDKEFQARVIWDIPVLEGYAHEFFRNYSFKPSLYNGFFGLLNPGMIVRLFKEPKSVIVIHGWGYITNVLVILFARIAGHKVCLRGETPLNQEVVKSKKTRFLKKLFLQWFLFRFIHRFLFIGYQNKMFYKALGVSDRKLVFTPYAVDNTRFREAAEKFLPMKAQLRKSLGVPLDARAILFTAKYIDKKKPIDLLEAYQLLDVSNKCLIMVGEGTLRDRMQSFINDHKLENVILTGFVNQSDIEKYYAIADVFVLCSGEGETWGLSTNEAMNFNLPVVISETAGCSSDLVDVGKNGFVFRTGDVSALSSSIGESFKLGAVNSSELIRKYSFETILKSFKDKILNN